MHRRQRGGAGRESGGAIEERATKGTEQMRRTATRWLARILLMLLPVVLLMGGLELALRTAPPGRPGRAADDRPDVIYYPGDGRISPWSRGHPDPLRIAVVGDSVTYGTGCQFYDTYSQRLEALLNLNEGQRPAEVRVWAKGGNNPDTEVRYLPAIEEWQPDILILGICLNDAENAHKMGQVSAWRMETLPAPPPIWLAAVLRHTRAGSFIYQKLAARKARRGYLAYYHRLYDREYSGWRLFVQAIRRFRAFSREQEITFVPVVFPLFSDVDRYPFDWVHEQIGEVFRTEGIAYVDLLDVFRGQSPQRLQVIPLVDAHPNEIAHRQAAENLFHYLLANRLVDAGYAPRQLNTSQREMWRILDRYLHQVVEVDPGMAGKLAEPEDGPPADPP